MSETKLSSDEVPSKFAEWLLSMGCPAEKVPSVDKIDNMCRGHYMIWRSLMERAGPKEDIRRKRLQVFCDDVRKCQRNNDFGQQDSAIVPEELTLWEQQHELRAKASKAKRKLHEDRQNLNSLLAKIGDKMAQCKLARRNLENAQRRAYLLQTLADELSTKRANLKETLSIATTICGSGDDAVGNVQVKLDRFLSGASNEPRLPDPLASSSVASGAGDSSVSEEHQLLPLLQCGSDLCSQLYTRRAALLRACAPNATTPHSNYRQTPQSVLAHTAAMHCNLTLEATKNKIHYKQAHNKLVNAVTELNNALSGESCELLVLRCERAHSEARVNTLKVLLDELACLEESSASDKAATSVATVDRAIEMKRDELKKVMAGLVTTERKIVSVKDCLGHVFEWFASEMPGDIARFKGVQQLDMPQESMVTLRQFYETRRESKKVELSLELEASDGSVHCPTDNPKFPDELRLYLSQFNLEKNSQLVLESGQKIWISQIVESSIHGLHTKWLAAGLPCSLLAPSDGLDSNLRRLAEMVHKRDELSALLQGLPELRKVTEIDITSYKEREAQIIDRTKKRQKENLDLVLKTNKTISINKVNLTLWSDNKWRKYISPSRTVNDIGYKGYESWYLDNLY